MNYDEDYYMNDYDCPIPDDCCEEERYSHDSCNTNCCGGLRGPRGFRGPTGPTGATPPINLGQQIIQIQPH